jgi:tRNA uridine 5-carboxymethylaminomethyl modification enzyme
VRRTAHELLAHPGIDVPRLAAIWPEFGALAPEVAEQLEADALYAGYLERQQADVVAFRRDEALRLPAGLDYGRVAGLSTEAREKLAAARPMSLGQAARLEGMTPAALVALLAHVKNADLGARA